MFRIFHPRFAALLAGVTLFAACGPPPSSSPSPGLVVITAGGVALNDGAVDVPTTLDLRVSAGAPLHANTDKATLDGNNLALQQSGTALTASVAAMQLASAHKLVITVLAEPPRTYNFQVIAPTAASAATHSDAKGKFILDLAFANQPEHAQVESLLPAGNTLRWIDTTHLTATWPNPPGGTVTLPNSLITTKGSHLAADLSISLARVTVGQLRRVVVPAALTSAWSALTVGFSVDTSASHLSAVQHVSELSALSPTGLTAGADGSLTGTVDATAADAVIGHAAALWPVLQNDSFDGAKLSQLLHNTTAESSLIAALRKSLAASHAQGLQLDFENVVPEDGPALTAFAQQLGAALHANNRRFIIDVVPHKPDHINVISAAYDVPALTAASDYVVLMAYDEHTEAALSGPVAGLDWDLQVLKGTMPSGTQSHVLLGIPLYARTWRDDGSTPVADSYADAVATTLAAPDARVDYDFAAATPIIRGHDGQTSVTTYFDDAPSIAAKVALARQQNLAGVALWRLGFEASDVWSVLPLP